LGTPGRRRWSFKFWIVELMLIAVIPEIVLLLQYSEEGYMRRNGIRVTAFVDELPPGKDSCVECPLPFTLHDEQYHVNETLVGGQSGEGDDRRYFPGEAIELYVDPNDMTHTIEVKAIKDNVRLGRLGIALGAVFAVAWPVYEFGRPIPQSITHAPN
jgi:hypothetical protein